MVKQAILQSHRVSTFEDAEFAIDNFHTHNPVVTSVWQGHLEEDTVAAYDNVPSCVSLNLEELKCFEVVERQYESLGVVFHNSLAIQPSNPAFPAQSGLTVLMGSPKSGFLEATFVQPVNWVGAFVTSSQRLIICAYDRDRQLIGQATLPGANLANSDSPTPPNTLLSVAAKGIHSVTFCAFDGQFTLDNFRFCF